MSTTFSTATICWFLLRQKQSHLESFLPNSAPSAKVCGRVCPAVSGRKNVARAPIVEQRPNISSGRMGETLAWASKNIERSDYKLVMTLPDRPRLVRGK